MKRRNFLKYLSSIPLIGIPVKLLANTQMDAASRTSPPPINPDKYVGTKTWFDGEKMNQERITREEFYADSDDPYADVAEHLYKNYWNNSAEMNAKWLKRKS